MSTSALANPANLSPNQTTTALDRSVAQNFLWDSISPDYYNVYAASYQIRYRQQGTTPWTTSALLTAIDQTGSSQRYIHTFAANTFTAGLTYEWQVQVTDTNGGVSDWSSSAFFAAAAPSTTPTITAPAAGASITSGTTNLTWTVTTQYAYRVRVRAGVNAFPIYYDSGVLVNSGARSFTVPLPDPGSRTIELTVQAVVGGPWSTAANVTVTAAGVTPMTPVIATATTSDDAAIGVRHNLSLVATNPTPTGGAPAVTLNEWYARRVGDTSSGTYLTYGANAQYPNLPQGSWQVRVKAISADGRSSFSAWTTLTLQPNLRGVVLGLPTDPLQTILLMFNDEGASRQVSITAETLRYVGRKRPIVEYDSTAEDETVSVERILVKLVDEAQVTALLTLLRARTPICYRDKRGRKVIGLLNVGPIKDAALSYETSISMTAVDYSADLLV